MMKMHRLCLTRMVSRNWRENLELEFKVQALPLFMGVNKLEMLRCTWAALEKPMTPNRVEFFPDFTKVPIMKTKNPVHKLAKDSVTAKRFEDILSHAGQNLLVKEGADAIQNFVAKGTEKLKEEAVASYRQLRDLARRLRQRKDDASMQVDSQSEPDSLPSVDDNNCSKFKTGLLGEAVREVSQLVSELVEGEVIEVELDRTRKQLEERTEELKRRSDQVMELTSKVNCS